MTGSCLPPNCPVPFGDRHSRNTLFLRPSPFIVPNGISIGSGVFVWVPNAMLYNALSMGKKASQIAPSPWDFVTPPEEDRATAMPHAQKFGKDRACGWGDILADRQPHRQTGTQTRTQTCVSQYFVTAPAGEVKNENN